MPTIGNSSLNESVAAKTEINEATPTENTATVESSVSEHKPIITGRELRDAERNQPYTDRKTITISLINRYSYYRKANDKTMDKRNEFIGSCVRSSQTLAANKDEVNAYFPNLIGISPSDPRYVNGVKEWLNNIQVRVDELGKEINVTFIYNTYDDYLLFSHKELAIENEFNSIPRNNLREVKRGLENKINALNALESEKYKYGHPENVADYLLYRHCLLYKDIAKDPAIINSDKNVRFYFRDNKKEAELQIKLRTEINAAKRNYVALCGDKKSFDEVYIQYCVLNNLAIIPAMQEADIVKENNLDRFSVEQPDKFNKICNDKDISIKSNIELLIARGVFNRHAHSQNIVSADGDFIGANMKEAVAFFKNSDNAIIVQSYLNKLKFI